MDMSLKPNNSQLTEELVLELEKVIGLLNSMHAEVSALAKKSANDAVNSFKLGLFNSVIQRCNVLLGAEYRPFEGFEQFDIDNVPTNSDVAVVTSQYMEAIELFRSRHIELVGIRWRYQLSGGTLGAETTMPAKLARK